MLPSLDLFGHLIEKHLRCTCFCLHCLWDAKYAFPHCLHFPDCWFGSSVSFLVGIAGLWTTTQGLHPLGAAFATVSARARQVGRRGQEACRSKNTMALSHIPSSSILPTQSNHRGLDHDFGQPVSSPSSTSNLLCEMGLKLLTILALLTCSKDPMRTWV